MPKLQNPPQGGEKYLCLTLFCTMMLSVVSAVAIIYSIVIIYLPSKMVLESNITGPAMCTTLSMERNIDSIEFCHNWSSCEEWCLSKVCKGHASLGKGQTKTRTHFSILSIYNMYLHFIILSRHSITNFFTL